VGAQWTLHFINEEAQPGELKALTIKCNRSVGDLSSKNSWSL